ncbi:MAG: MotE family protein [Alphaproteobacteria bacterium]
MKQFLKKLPLNVFTLLIAAMALAFVFRIVDVVIYGGKAPAAIATAQAQRQVNEEPPPISAADIEKAVRDTARAADETIAPTRTAPATSGRAASITEDPSLDPEQRIFSAAEIEVLQSLARRREEIERREQKLAAEEALLKAAEQEVDRKIAELNKLRGELESLLGQQQTMEEDRIASLVKIYENMKPKEAAAIFNTLDMDVLLAVISRMAERRSSPIIANMDTNKARLVTIRLAEQRQLPQAAPAKPAGTR